MPPLFDRCLRKLTKRLPWPPSLDDRAGVLPVLSDHHHEICAFALAGFDFAEGVSVPTDEFERPSLPSTWCWLEFPSSGFWRAAFLLEARGQMTAVRLILGRPFLSAGPCFLDLGDARAIRAAHAERQGFLAEHVDALGAALALVNKPSLARREHPPHAGLALRLARRGVIPAMLPQLRSWTEISPPAAGTATAPGATGSTA